MSAVAGQARRGGPLVMLCTLIMVWIAGRALTWENPFPLPSIDIPEILLAEHRAPSLPPDAGVPPEFAVRASGSALDYQIGGSRDVDRQTSLTSPVASGTGYGSVGHHLLWMRALGAKLAPGGGGAAMYAMEDAPKLSGVSPIAPITEIPVSPDRWTLDSWAFWRQGSNSTAFSQGRVPIYGASQMGARLDWRAAPSSRHDPRFFVRGYRALVSAGETEVATGISARPIGKIPVRASAEIRVTDRTGGTDIRAAIYATTELAPQKLPAGFRLEAYAGAGYVGGNGATGFADGQAGVIREFAELGGPLETRAKLSVGAGAWGGAQRDAERVDIGPTLRVDMSLGQVPARFSVDWRERVAGNASPGSGIAATLSTRF